MFFFDRDLSVSAFQIVGLCKYIAGLALLSTSSEKLPQHCCKSLPLCHLLLKWTNHLSYGSCFVAPEETVATQRSHVGHVQLGQLPIQA